MKKYSYLKIIFIIGLIILSGCGKDSFSVRLYTSDNAMQNANPGAPTIGEVNFVEYRVSGVKKASVIEILGKKESLEQYRDVKLPWNYKLHGAGLERQLYLSAKSDMENGCIEVEIYINDILWRNKKTCGAYVTATVSNE